MELIKLSSEKAGQLGPAFLLSITLAKRGYYLSNCLNSGNFCKTLYMAIEAKRISSLD
jgi:hypothetical protein